MNFILFTKKDYDYFVEQGMLDEEYAKLLEYKIKGYSITKMAELLCCSEARVSVMTKILKEKIKKIL